MAPRTMLLAGLVVALAAPALPALSQTASQSANVKFVADADSAAGLWVRANPDGMAIAIRLGQATPVTAEKIESTLRADLRAHGVTKVSFFYERGGDGGSSVIFNTRNHAWGPFGLAESRAHVREASEQHLFEVRRGLN